ncbi:hypothetical protein GCK72_009862 [Caenorhabditis remanei]|uniref:Abnormal cell migration protein 18-like fibronectin type I domain-containing protein n=1 Tax=Caenorhabditis remanei TaxID=31234 RepID=A0A6A5H418_CAERE|nr:hypothetical protein GCK72_009862 [Caenorhabditis remanei]KAF1761606.1 hypothetical protein GCK72_009862 [Caenorhabditis remanei]
MKHFGAAILAIVCLQLVESAAVFDRNYTKPYVLKKTWVQNFIKFQYIFEGNQQKPKIVPLGCSPTNVDSDNYLKPGETSIEHDFLFSCEEGEDGVLNYEATACIDAHGEVMHPGETRRLSNGTVVLHSAGCYFNETIYSEDEKWVEPQVNPADSSIDGRLMQCFRPHYSYYESHVVGCVIGKLGVLIGEFGQLLDGSYVKCVEAELGHVSLKTVNVDELQCKMDEQTFAHASQWTDDKKGANMKCNYGHIVKESCVIGNETLSIGQEVPVSRGCIFLCHPQTNVYICDDYLQEFQIIETEGQDLGPIEGNQIIVEEPEKKKSLKSVFKF